MPQAPNQDPQQSLETAALTSARRPDSSDPTVSAGSKARLPVGSVLNHIYQVRRILARGGMGEVYEGVNINTDERVAIKVILPHLAEDPKIQGMFRTEARTLTRLTHPALVQYRVLAQEPVLNLLYIVTEFVDGAGLDEEIGDIAPDEADLRALTRRLADGLRTAHELGAVHRDISPDNILLPEGRLDAAKIIDFGIARDIDTPQGTQVGDAFAGKLGYVAPEQLGDFDREIGPWTDVYSLGLVILAIAAGGGLDMGITPAEAVDRRRAGPDLSPLPEGLRPTFARMLEPDPALRLRSMEAVIDALDHGLAAPPPAAPPKRPSPLFPAAVGLGLLVVFGLTAARLWPRPAPRTPVPATLAAPPEAALDAALRSESCAWINERLSRGPDGLHLELSGAAGDPAGVAAQLTRVLETSGEQVAAVDHSQVRPLPPAACGAVTAFARLHAASSEATWIRPQASEFHVMASPLCRNAPPSAVAVVTLNPPSPGADEDIALLRLDQAGGVVPVFSGLADFKAKAVAPGNGKGTLLEDLGPQGLRISYCEPALGPKGVLMIRGRPPFDLGLRPGPAAAAGAVSSAWIASAGKAQGWRTQMAWYDVDRSALTPALPTAKPAASLVRRLPRYAAAPPPPPKPAPARPQPDRQDTLGTDFK